MKIDWQMMRSGTNTNEHGMEFGFVTLVADVTDSPTDGTFHIRLEEYSDPEVTYQTVIKATAPLPVATAVIDDMLVRFDESGHRLLSDLLQKRFTLQTL